MNKYKEQEVIYSALKEIAKKYNVKIITATQESIITVKANKENSIMFDYQGV